MSATSTSSLNTVIISAGSNIEPEKNTAKTVEILNNEATVLGVSKWILTEPDGYKDQPDFLNGAICVQTEKDRVDFDRYLKELEQRLGRVKGPIKAGPRTIDLDILIWNQSVVHNDFYEKPYARIPALELIESLSLQLDEELSG